MIVINSKVIENQVWKVKFLKDSELILLHSKKKKKTYHEDFEFVFLDYFIESCFVLNNNFFSQDVARH